MISNELYFVSNNIASKLIPNNVELSREFSLLIQKSTPFRDLITTEGATLINETFLALNVGLSNLNTAIAGGSITDIQQKAFSVFSLASDVFKSFATIEMAIPLCQIRIGADEYSAMMNESGAKFLDLESTLTKLLFIAH